MDHPVVVVVAYDVDHCAAAAAAVVDIVDLLVLNWLPFRHPGVHVLILHHVVPVPVDEPIPHLGRERVTYDSRWEMTRLMMT
jgi:hypothetical protein